MHTNHFRLALAGTVSALALGLISPAVAQTTAATTAPTEGGDLAEIVVTARRVEENLQSVPIAITAVTSETLAKRDIKDISSLVSSVPGLMTFGSPQTLSFIFMRGVTSATPSYFADVPAANSPYTSFFDISGVQVLKGPQGTLFGQASNAGAILYTPIKPGSDLGGYISGSAGNYGRRSLEGALNVPLADGKILVRLAGQTFHRDGYVIDVTTKTDYGDQNYYVIRPSIVFRPTERLENYTIIQYASSHNNGNAGAAVLYDFNFSPGNQLPSLNTQAALNGVTRAQWDAMRDKVLARQIQLGPYKVDGYSVQCATPAGPVNVPCSDEWAKRWFFANTTTFEVSDQISLKNIFGYSEGKSFAQPADTDFTTLRIGDGSARNFAPVKDAPVWSEEFQIQGREVFGELDFTLGAFATGTHNFPVVTYAKTLGVTDTASLTKTSSRSHALYGQGTYKLDSVLQGLSVTAGYRRTWDAAKRILYNLNPNTLAILNVVGGHNTAAGDAKWTANSYTLGVQWQYTPETMFFLTNSKGFGSGGLQNAIGFEVFDPDSLNNFELGTKTTFDLAGMRVRFNGSVFYGIFTNQKITSSRLVQQQPPPAPPVGAVITINAGESVIKGIDAEAMVRVNSRLDVGGYLAYTDAKYTKYETLSPVTGQLVDVTSTPYSFSPKVKWELRATYRLPVPVSLGDLSLSGSLAYQGRMYHGAAPKVPLNPANPNTGNQCVGYRTAANGYGPLSADGKKLYWDCTPSYYTSNANLDWKRFLGHDDLTASFFVTNLLQNEQGNGGIFGRPNTGIKAYFSAPPRMYGAKLTQRF